MVSIDKARYFVYDKGLPWEKRLFDFLFCAGSLEKLHKALLCYKNDDGGWGNGIEHDLKCPDSNPLSLEFLLTINRDTGMPIGNLLDGTVKWLFMAYHAFDYYSNIGESEETIGAESAMAANIIECVESAKESQYHTLFHFIKSPDDKLAKLIPNSYVGKFLDYLQAAQREDGGWNDEHGLEYWQPYITIEILCALRNFGRI
ncbi:MAG: hypothetical protein ACYCYE_14685 [Clostridia bacterium]